MMSESNPIVEGCEEFRNQLQTVQQDLVALLNQPEHSISADIATHYNQVMFHLQSAREELRAVQKKSQTIG